MSGTPMQGTHLVVSKLRELVILLD